MKTILYIGNHLSQDGGYPSVAETLAPLLAPQIRLRLVSRKRNRLIRLMDMLSSVVRYGRNKQPVIIDTYSTLNFYYALAVGLLCRWLGVRYCCILHGGNLPARLQRNPRLCKMLFGASMENISPSAYLQEAFRKAGYPSRVIPNFIPIENYPFFLRRQVRPRLLWVRAFDATYNPQMAIRVLQQVAAVYPEAELCMVGPDKDGSQSTCETLAFELGLAERVRFTGRLPKAEWIALSADYDIFINTTNFDNTPVSVIEALALGLPVVSTNVGGMPFLLEHGLNGLLSNPDDVTVLAENIIHLVQRSDLANKLSIEGRKKAETFSLGQVKPLWIALLHSNI